MKLHTPTTSQVNIITQKIERPHNSFNLAFLFIYLITVAFHYPTTPLQFFQERQFDALNALHDVDKDRRISSYELGQK